MSSWKPLRLSMAAMLAVSMWPTQAQASHVWTSRYDQDRYYWDLYTYSWYWSNGSRDAFDGWGYATINGENQSQQNNNNQWNSSAFRNSSRNRFTSSSWPYGTREFNDRGTRSSTPTYSSFRVQARTYVPASGHPDSRNYGRNIWNITNTTGSARNLNFRIYGNLGSDSYTRVTNTSDGNTTWSTSDTWVATDDAWNGVGWDDPALSFIYMNSGGLRPSYVRRIRDWLYIDWNNVTVPARGTVTFMLFTTQNRDRASSFREAQRIVTLPDEVMANLTAAEKQQLVNFNLGADVENQTLTVSENNAPALRATWRFSERATARAQLYENSSIPAGETQCSGGALVATNTLAANTNFSYTWQNTNNWNRIKRGVKYCVKITATDGGNQAGSAVATVASAIGAVSADIDQYTPSTRAVVRFTANPGAGTFTELYPTANCSGTRLTRNSIPWNSRSVTRNYTGDQARRNTSYCLKVINGYATRNFTLGTVNAEPRDYPTTLTYVLGRLRAVDGGGEDFEDDLDDAITHVSVAKAYWDARTDDGALEDFQDVAINWGPSFRRAVRAIKSMSLARRNDAPRALKVYETDLAAAILQQVKVHAVTTMAGRIGDDTPDYWPAIRTAAVNAVETARDQASGQPKAAAAADAYDKLAAMYDSRYSAENRVSEAQIAIDAVVDEDLEDRPRDELIAALNNTLRYGLKLEIKAARDTNTAGRTQLDAVLTSIAQISTCMGSLQSQGLSDHDFTECYMEVVKIVKKLREVQGALVDTYTWRGLLGIGVYGMLDISIYHSTNSLVTQEGVDEDEEAQTGISEFRAGLADLRAGNVTVALQRYINNECRIVNLYNRYWAGPGNPQIDGTEACARVCGNSNVEEGEQCDDGNFTDTDACTTSCQNNVCGDGALYRGRETCDDGNRIDTDACTNACATARCGDRIVRAGTEECDDGNQVNDDNCTNQCLAARCGDGIRQGTEQCDDGDTNNDNTCSNTCRSNIITMATGYLHTCFLKSSRVYCSGYNGYGQLGDNSTSQRTTAVQVRNLTDVKQVTAANHHSCALKDNGTVWCWGYNSHGNLGDGTTTRRRTPVQTRGLTNVTQIATGSYHNCARKSDGTVWCWGYNGYGQLGIGNTSNSTTPRQVRGLTGATNVTLGRHHACARMANGTVKCWGYGYFHNVRNTSQRSYRFTTPQTVNGVSGVAEFKSYGYGNCYRRANGTVGCFGYGCHGQMGDGGSGCYNHGNRTVSGATDSVELGGGAYHMCSRDSAGAVKCWGYNYYGQIGDGSTTNRNTATLVSSMTDAVSLSQGAAAFHTCASRSGGSTSCWGRNQYGGIGIGRTSTRATTPVNVVGEVGVGAGLGSSSTNPGRSCKQIKDTRLAAGETARTGTYFLDPNGGSNSDARAVYCDMTTDGGGWTQVANTYDYTLNDQSQGYYESLQYKVPTGRHLGIWNGMRAHISGNSDIRFTCKLNKNANSNDVDLSFYNIHWYREITTGSDGSSCFEEGNGRGYTRPAPQRRNNLNNTTLPRGDNWQYGYLEGEDYCGDTGDFTVDFDNRGMDTDQRDGTDWGEDDGTKKCGYAYGNSNASWQIWVRER